MFTYKNVSPFFYVVPHVGEVEPGGTLESEFELENANLELIDNPLPAAPQIAPTVAPAIPPVTATVPAPPQIPATNEVKQ